MKTEVDTKTFVRLGHIPHFISRWGVLIDPILFGLFVIGALCVKYPEVVTYQIDIGVSENDEGLNRKNAMWVMSIPDSLSCYIPENTRVNIAVNGYPPDEYGYLTGYVKYITKDQATGDTNLTVIAEGSLSHIGKRIEVGRQSQGIGSITIYRSNLFEKLLLSLF